jgi:hypothetical protein
MDAMRLAKVIERLGTGLTIAGAGAGFWVGFLLWQSRAPESPTNDVGIGVWQLWGLPAGQLVIAAAAIIGVGLVLTLLPRLRRR